MATSNIKAIIHSEIHKVWEMILAVENHSTWRSDLSKTKILNENQFVEYTKEGYATTFTISIVDPYKRWEFDMENSRHSLLWT